MSFLLGSSKTYFPDLPLFQELGLPTFRTDDQKELFLGSYKLPEYENATVDIWVTCMPAQFWRFEINTCEGDKYKVETGSGCMSDFWPSVVKIAESMLTVTPIKTN